MRQINFLWQSTRRRIEILFAMLARHNAGNLNQEEETNIRHINSLCQTKCSYVNKIIEKLLKSVALMNMY